jgi:vacuolar-type H+-ATPase subunit I/STV1
MTNPLGNDASQNAKNLAQNIAKQIGKIPFEVGQTAVDQVTGNETSESAPWKETAQKPEAQNQRPPEEEEKEKALQEKDNRTIAALEQEMKEIRERKEAVKSYQEQTEERQKAAEENAPQTFMEADSKKSRNIFNLGQKPKSKTGQLQADRQKVHVEKPIQSTG